MKPEKDPLKAVFDALQKDDEPISPERQAKAVKRFQQERIFKPVEGEKRHGFIFVDRDADSRPAKKPHIEETKAQPKDRPRRS